MFENKQTFYGGSKKIDTASKINPQPGFKVILFNCIAHPSCASFFAWLARAASELVGFSMKAEQFREITGRFLLNERGDPH